MNRILLIEDDPGAQLLYRNRLTDLGYEVVLSSTGAMGLMEARSGSFDLYLVDIGLGSGIDGYEVCRRLKTIPGIHAVPVVLISGHVKAQEDLHRGYEAGCQSFLVKGDLTLLEDVVRAMLRIKSLQDDLALQNRLLEEHNRRLEAEKARNADLTQSLSSRSGRPGREHARPDGMLLVDGEGVVWTSDRGAREIFGQTIDGKQLALLAPASRLEALVRDTRTEPHESIRFEVPERPGRAARQLLVSVYPFMPRSARSEPALRAIVFHDASRASSTLDAGRGGELRRDMASLIEAAREVFRPGALLGTSALVRELRAQVAQAARSDEPVVLRGPAGSGKSFVARVLHYSSSRSGPFVEIACGAFGSSQLALELFGSEGVAGAFQHAQGGTLHLQDVERLPAQLEERVRASLPHGRARAAPAGSEYADVRLVASTSTEPLTGLARELGARPLLVPGLRDRPEDIDALARHFLARHGRFEDARFSPDAARALARHDWPGSVGELEAIVQSASLAAQRSEIDLADLPQPLSELSDARRIDGNGRNDRPPRADPVAEERELALLSALDSTVSLLDAYEKRALLHALHLKGGDKLAAAKLLRVGKSTFYRKLKQHGIT